MKTKHILPLLLMLFAFGFWACEKEETDNISKVVDVTFPAIKLKGDTVVVLNPGDSYTEAGATLIDDISGASSDIQPDSPPEIDTNTPGLYFVTYTAANANGFETVVRRPVVVSTYNGSVDISGNYVRSNGAELNIHKVGRGVYLADNVGGVLPPSAAILPVLILQTADDAIDIPLQPVPNGYGDLECIDEAVTPTSVSWIVVNPGFGPARRTFTKQ